jgi:glycosyltransferase involved in cell wall biosynthesis
MVKGRLLVLTPRFPYPTIGGDRIRIIHLCRALSREFELTLLSLCDNREEMRFEPHDGLFKHIWRVYLPRWRSYLNTLRALPGSRPLQLAYYDCPAFRERVEILLPYHDTVLAHLIRTGQYVLDSPIPRVLEMTDAISMNYLRMRHAKGNHSWKRLIYSVEQKRLQRYETKIVRQFDRVWLTSDVDRQFVDPIEESDIDVIPNGTDIDLLPYRPPVDGANTIVFIGNMVSAQNQDACLYFIRTILPRVRAKAPVVFRIVGNAPEGVRRRFANFEGVELTGRLEHIFEGTEGAFCGVSPVRAAAGIQNKVLEYLALGLPCVTSALGLGGIAARPERDVLLYHDAEEAAAQILRLYENAALRMSLAEAGRELAMQRYDWKNIYRTFVNSCLTAAARHAQWRGVAGQNISSAA